MKSVIAKEAGMDWSALKTALFVAILFVSVLFVFDPGKFTGHLVQSDKSLIFVELDIPQEYERVYPGGTLLVRTEILQRGGDVEIRRR